MDWSSLPTRPFEGFYGIQDYVTVNNLLEDGRKLRVRSGFNIRELGGYDTPDGPTRYHRFLRAGGTRSLTEDDLGLLRDWGVSRVVDLRSFGESPQLTCRFAKQDWVEWSNVPLYEYDLSAPAMQPVREIGGYFVSGYLRMLSSNISMRRLFAFVAEAEPNECVLFHCAAGMDRTGVVSMLLLGLAGASRHDIVADYAYSFGDVDEVDATIDTNGDLIEQETLSTSLRNRIRVISTVYDTVIHEHGSIKAYLSSCEIPDSTLDRTRKHLLEA